MQNTANKVNVVHKLGTGVEGRSLN